MKNLYRLEYERAAQPVTPVVHIVARTASEAMKHAPHALVALGFKVDGSMALTALILEARNVQLAPE